MTKILSYKQYMPNVDPKAHYITKINKFEDNKKINKIKAGRLYLISVSVCVDAILFVLIEGVSWSLAAKLTTNNYSYDKTINRHFNEWVKAGIFRTSHQKVHKD